MEVQIILTYERHIKDYILRPFFQAYCALCEALHDPDRGEERIVDLKAWWAGDKVCRLVQQWRHNGTFDKKFWAYRDKL